MKNNEIIKAVEGIYSKGVLYTKENLTVLIYGSFKREFQYLEGYFNLKWSDSLNNWVLFQYVPENMYHLRQWYYDLTGRIGE